MRADATEPNAGIGDPTDGRKRYDWETRYPSQAQREILAEACYLFLFFVTSLVLILATWRGWISTLLSISAEETPLFARYTYYAASGMLGGVIFGIKYLYRVAARGYWHQDRRLWRIMSPFIAMTVSLVVGIMIDAGILGGQRPVTGAAFVSIGFIAGYFADEAVGKMYEIANVLFGRSAMTKAGHVE